MPSTSERPPTEQTRTYDRASSVVFLKTDAPFGGLSNMAGGFPLHVQGTRIYTSEALYQACRFPHLPEVQRLIIGQASPMTAKMKSKPHRKNSRPDWDRVRVKVMRWCLRVKLAQNWAKFSEVLLRTDDRPIVEESRRDDFWGAKPVDEQTLVGMNVLGRLLMELREAVKAQGMAGFQAVEPLDIPGFLFLGRPIGTVGAQELGAPDVTSTSTARAPDHEVIKETAEQGSLFDTPAAREGYAPAYVASPTPESTRLSELKPYGAMKNSGVPWLGEVPEHWVMRRGKWLFRHKKQLNADRANSNVLSLTLRGVVNNDPENPEGLVPKDYATYQVFSKGDLVFKLIDLENLRTSRVGLVHEDGIMSSAYVRLVPQLIVEIQFFFRQYFDLYQRGIYNQLGAGVRSTLGPADLLDLSVTVPPLPEQAAIVRFLDHADRRIRRYIRAKQKLIKLLEEQKQAIIHRAVTRGLDPNVRLKPSGVEWLGDVPEHWEVAPFKRRVGFQEGPGIMAADFRDEGVPLLRISCLQGQIATLAGCNFLDPETVRRRWSHFAVRPGDYLLSASASTGNVVLATDHVFGAIPYTGILRLWPISDRAFMPYVRLYMRCRPFQDQIDAAKSGVAIEHFGPTHLKRMQIALPPVAEQRAIVEFIEAEVAPFASAAARAANEIALLREYHTRLIADVVTGKLDVRDAAARLPEQDEEPEPLDEIEAFGAAGEESAVDDLDSEPEEAEA